MKVYYKEIGSQLKKRMQDRGLSAKVLSLRCKIPKSTLDKFFAGNAYKGYMKILEKLSIPLDLTTLEISFFEKENNMNNYTSTSFIQPFVVKESPNKSLFDPDILLPENRKIFDNLVKKNQDDIIRREAALEKQKKK